MEYVKGLLSICCTCYNHEKYIEDFVKSVWDNDYKNVEIIVIDDGSTDRSVEVLKSLKEKSPCRFEIITQENTYNIGLNFNRTLSKARGEFVTIMSADDYYTNDAFSTKLNIMNNDENLAFVVSKNVYILDENGNVNLKDAGVDMFTPNITIDELCEIEYSKGTFAVQGNIFRHNIIDEVGRFDEDIRGDDIIIRTKVLKYLQKHREFSFRFIDNPSFIYRQHGNNYSKQTIKMLEIFLDVYNRYWNDRPFPAPVCELCANSTSKYSIEEVLPLFAKYPKCINFLCNNELLLFNIYKNLSKKFFWKFIASHIFQIEKINNKYKIVLFNTIKISYKKHK